MLFFMQNGKIFGRQKHRKRLIIEGCKVCCDVATGNHPFFNRLLPQGVAPRRGDKKDTRRTTEL